MQQPDGQPPCDGWHAELGTWVSSLGGFAAAGAQPSPANPSLATSVSARRWGSVFRPWIGATVLRQPCPAVELRSAEFAKPGKGHCRKRRILEGNSAVSSGCVGERAEPASQAFVQKQNSSALPQNNFCTTVRLCCKSCCYCSSNTQSNFPSLPSLSQAETGFHFLRPTNHQLKTHSLGNTVRGETTRLGVEAHPGLMCPRAIRMRPGS